MSKNSKKSVMTFSMEDLEVKPVATKKNNVKDTPWGEAGAIPAFGSGSVVICGQTKSGKTVLLNHLFTTPGMYKDYFDDVYCISSTGNTDDVMKSIMESHPKKNIFTDSMKGIKHIAKIMAMQKALIEEMGFDKVPKIAILFDDFVNDRSLLKDPSFKLLFIGCRHYSIMCFALIQHFKSLPKLCRDNANNVMFFAGTTENMQMISETDGAPKYSNKEFISIMNDVFEEPYSFLYIKRDEPFKTRYRKKLKDIINLPRLKGAEDDQEKQEEQQNKLVDKLEDKGLPDLP